MFSDEPPMNCEIPDLDENAHWIFGCTDSDPFDSNSPCIAECVEGYTSISAGDDYKIEKLCRCIYVDNLFRFYRYNTVFVIENFLFLNTYLL